MNKIIISVIIAIFCITPIFAQDYLSLGDEAYDNGELQKAISYYEKGAANGDGYCCATLTSIYFGGTELGSDLEKALSWAKKGYELKDAYSTGMLGYLSFFTKANLRDLTGMQQAVDYMAEGCLLAEKEENFDPLFGSLANMLAGYYVETSDVPNCKKWLKFATDHYLYTPDVIGNTSYIYLVLKDYSNAYKYAMLANQDEKLYSNFVIGFCLANGVGGVEANQPKAFKHMQSAALIGMPNGKAEYMMGVFYEKGIGCIKNMATAKEWYRKGAKKGDDQATLKLKQLQ